MTGDAEVHATHDEERRDRAEARNAADNTIYNARKAMDRHELNISETARGDLLDKIQELELALEDADTERLAAMTRELSATVQEVIVRAREATATPSGESGDGTDVVDEEIS
jgi:molecular chaperone DnaK